MKKNKTANKLRLPKEIVRELHVPELAAAAGGGTITCKCDSCGHPLSTCV